MIVPDNMDDQGIKIEIINQPQISEEEENIDDFPDEDQHICLLCDAKYPIQMNLMKHIANEHDIKFECKLCNELFKSHLALR